MILPVQRIVRTRIAEAVTRLYGIAADDPLLGAIAVDNQPTTMAELGRLLQTSFARGRDRTVTIRGDERVGLGTVVAIMDVARRAGAEKIGVATRHADR